MKPLRQRLFIIIYTPFIIIGFLFLQGFILYKIGYSSNIITGYEITESCIRSGFMFAIPGNLILIIFEVIIIYSIIAIISYIIYGSPKIQNSIEKKIESVYVYEWPNKKAKQKRIKQGGLLSISKE